MSNTTITTLSKSNVISLGFMLCAFFLGAGNIIFPTSAGYQAGTSMTSTMVGFLLTGVGLPLVGVIAIAISGGSLTKMTRFLPAGSGTFATIILFIAIGPAFATPRTSLVALELAVQPLFSTDTLNEFASSLPIMVTAGFFIVATGFSLFRGSLIDNIGKILTPILFILLIILAVSVVVAPWDTPREPIIDYAQFPFIKGFLDGYNTMDAFAALMFGGLIVDILKSKGIHDSVKTCKYLIIAGIIAAAGLSIVYISLFWLGATSPVLTEMSGSKILTLYVNHLYGTKGIYILGAVVFLACLTTAIGLLSACGDYFNHLTKNKFGYTAWVVLFAGLSFLVANVGLNNLIAMSIPALYALYPMVITIIILTFIHKFMTLRNPALIFRLVMSVSLMMGIIAAIKQFYSLTRPEGQFWMDFLSQASKLPLYKQDMEWVIPVICIIIFSLILDVYSPKEEPALMKEIK